MNFGRRKKSFLHWHIVAIVLQELLDLPLARAINAPLEDENCPRYDTEDKSCCRTIQQPCTECWRTICEVYVGKRPRDDEGRHEGRGVLVGLQPLLREQFLGGVRDDWRNDHVAVCECQAYIVSKELEGACKHVCPLVYMAGAVMPTICARQTDLGIPSEASDPFMVSVAARGTFVVLRVDVEV
jgi:hypothetical protein